jgi:hypothetical protein
MTFDKNGCVDVNEPTGSYTVDETVGNMEQETITTKTVELIVVRRDSKNGEAVPTVIGMEQRVRYHFPMADVLRIVKRTTIEEVIHCTHQEEVDQAIQAQLSKNRREYQERRRAATEEHLARIKAEADCLSQRRPRKKETEPRATCHATCCGAPNRHQSHLDGFCFDCRPSNSASREEVKY